MQSTAGHQIGRHHSACSSGTNCPWDFMVSGAMYPVSWPSNDLRPHSPLTKSEPLTLPSRVPCPLGCPNLISCHHILLPLQPLGIFLFLEHAKSVSLQGFATVDPSTWITLLPKSSLSGSLSLMCVSSNVTSQIPSLITQSKVAGCLVTHFTILHYFLKTCHYMRLSLLNICLWSSSLTMAPLFPWCLAGSPITIY